MNKSYAAQLLYRQEALQPWGCFVQLLPRIAAMPSIKQHNLKKKPDKIERDGKKHIKKGELEDQIVAQGPKVCLFIVVVFVLVVVKFAIVVVVIFVVFVV